MAQVAFVVPIIPGKKAKLEEFAKTLSGAKKEEFKESQKLFETTKETWFLQTTPAGDMIIVYSEMADVAKNMGGWIASKRPFEQWLKNEIKEITGLDFNQPMGEFPRQIFLYGY